jgi:hypothetical protein
VVENSVLRRKFGIKMDEITFDYRKMNNEGLCCSN